MRNTILHSCKYAVLQFNDDRHIFAAPRSRGRVERPANGLYGGGSPGPARGGERHHCEPRCTPTSSRLDRPVSDSAGVAQAGHGRIPLHPLLHGRAGLSRRGSTPALDAAARTGDRAADSGAFCKRRRAVAVRLPLRLRMVAHPPRIVRALVLRHLRSRCLLPAQVSSARAGRRAGSPSWCARSTLACNRQPGPWRSPGGRHAPGADGLWIAGRWWLSGPTDVRSPRSFRHPFSVGDRRRLDHRRDRVIKAPAKPLERHAIQQCSTRLDSPLTPSDNAAIDRVEQAAATLTGVLAVRDQGRSADGQARKALVVASSNGGNTGNPDLVGRIRALFAAAQTPPGLELHLTGPLAQATDASATAAKTGTNIRVFSVLFVVVLLFVVYRSLLAPLVTLLPAILSLLLAGPLIAQASQGGLPVSPATQTLLPVLLLGAGTDYGLFLVYRVREEIRRGAPPPAALVAAMRRVGQSVAYSALTVIAALSCLLLASFSLYQGLGPSLAIGVAVMLAAAMTLLPALLSIFGRALFWPAHPAGGQITTGAWGRVATRVVRRPLAVLVGGLILFSVLGAGVTSFATGGFASAPVSGSDSAAGAAAIAAHFPVANSNPETLLLRFATPIWDRPQSLAGAETGLSNAADLRSVTGPLDPNGTVLSIDQLVTLRSELGPAAALPPTPPATTSVPLTSYEAYRATAQFISSDGRTVQLYAHLAAGPAGSPAAINAVPA
ncbi:MAG: hypothetical protein E6J20_20855, partial [Chloroflexi bacterium]